LNYFSLEGSNSLKLVTGNDYYPYSDEKLKDGGIFTSIVKKILKISKVKYIVIHWVILLKNQYKKF